ncbi:hypothetical protein Taro_017093 [Colocasia esculenta]|uniref:Carboxypeptidase n=1 Tax=Colocasia esculenta TaxID=4460 RepID=A0A843UQ89_COLES|nr:hypothetical protein [Colocasia esculenta]
MAAPGSYSAVPVFLALAFAVSLSRRACGQWEEAHLVTSLPGQPAVGFRHYAGYVAAGTGEQKALFYWFFEAEEGEEKKPLVLWLNGVANLLFLEAPVGVGFSYTNRSADLEELGDRVTAQDSHAFLLNWFKLFPRFKSHDFYITGESYAGHYVPQLANLIYLGNKGATKDSYINFKGFMIGNAVINDETDQLGMVDYAWSHAIISDRLYHAVRRSCADFNATTTGNACSSAVKAFMEAYNDIDIYSIYTPVCLSSLSQRTNTRKNVQIKKLAVAPRMFAEHDLWHSRPSLPRAGYDPCTEDYVEKYFNREDVQKALHANLTKLRYPYTPCRSVFSLILFLDLPDLQDTQMLYDIPSFLVQAGFPPPLTVVGTCMSPHVLRTGLSSLSFHVCRSGVIEKWNDSPSTVLPIIRKLINAGLRIWIYSGDTDGRVPVTSTRYSVNAMGLTVKEEWRAWYHKKQVAGWVVEYWEGLTLATLRGAGHQVPAFAPDRSLSLLSHFLDGRPLPSSRR